MTQEQPFNLVKSLLAYETNQSSEDEVIELFQNLVDSGLAWQLQGDYGRTAVSLIEAGLITRKEPELFTVFDFDVATR